MSYRLSYIFILMALLYTATARATSQLTSQPLSASPEARMTSTSALLCPKGTASQTNYNHPSALQRTYGNAQTTSYKPLFTTASRKKAVRASQFGVVREYSQLPAVSISNRNWDDVSSTSATSNPTVVSSPGPRKVGPGGGVLPPDPFMPPVGDAPLWLILILVAAYVSFVTLRRNQNV